MSKRGIVLLLGLIVIVVLAILGGVFFKRSITDSHDVRRHASSSQAIWNAEQGLSRAVAALPSTAAIVDPGGAFQTNIAVAASDAVSTTFRITSTGQVTVTGAPIVRNIEAFIQYFPFQGSGNFDNAIEVNNNLSISGSVSILPNITYAKDFANVSFSDKFKVSTSDMRAFAMSQGTYYEDPGSPLPDFGQLSGPGQVTWVKITDPTQYLQIPKNNWEGKGILIVEGNARIEGSKSPEGFEGIVWVTGICDIRGNVDLTGTVISETTADVTQLAGTPVLTWNMTAINNALSLLGPLAQRARLSWREF